MSLELLLLGWRWLAEAEAAAPKKQPDDLSLRTVWSKGLVKSKGVFFFDKLSPLT